MNKSILKRLKICNANNMDYQTELQKFILMHNVTPHGTTGKTPCELMFGRNIRDKIPSIQDLVGEEINEEARDNDTLRKQKGKGREDKARGSKDTDIQIGDRVLVKNTIVPHKLTTMFDSAEYEVEERKGNELLLGKEGKSIRRHITQVKKLLSKEVEENNEDSEKNNSREDRNGSRKRRNAEHQKDAADKAEKKGGNVAAYERAGRGRDNRQRE